MSPVQVPMARVALSTASVYPDNWATAFDVAERLGYDGVEVMVQADPISQEAGALQALSDLPGIPVVSIHAPTLLLTTRVFGAEPWPKVDRSIEMAKDLGVDTVVLHPPFRWQNSYAREFVDGIALREHDHGERLAHVHLADGLGSARDEHLVPGRGDQPCAELLETLAAQRYSGAVVVEVGTRRLSPDEREVDLAEALAFARLHLAAAA